MGGEGRCAYEFANDALVDEDGDGEAEEADDGEAAARPAEVELEVLAAGVPLLDPPVLVHLHAATHLLPFLGSSLALLVGDGWRALCRGGEFGGGWCECDLAMQGTPQAPTRASLFGFLQIAPRVYVIFYFH